MVKNLILAIKKAWSCILCEHEWGFKQPIPPSRQAYCECKKCGIKL